MSPSDSTGPGRALASDDPWGRLPTRPLLGLDFADLGIESVLERLAERPAGAAFAYVVTPNADHLVRLAREPALGPFYHGAALRLLDSRVVARFARLLGIPPPPVVTGSDLTAALLAEVVRPGDAVTVLGAPEAVVAAARRRHPAALARVAHHDPPMGFDRDPAAMEAAVAFVEANPARFVLLCVGSPRQEAVAAALRRRGRATGLGLCIGASLLFVAGTERRAPRPVQRAGMEWAWRLAQDPRRLARRYLRDDPAVLHLLWQEARRRRR